MRLRPDKELLQRTSVFRSLDDTELEALSLCMQVRVCDPGVSLFREGTAGASLILVATGVLAATVRDNSGVDREINRMGCGEIVGEMAFLDPAPRSASVHAVTATTYYELDDDSFETLRSNSPRAAAAITWAIIRDVRRRLRRIDGLIADQLARSPTVEGAR